MESPNAPINNTLTSDKSHLQGDMRHGKREDRRFNGAALKEVRSQLKKAKGVLPLDAAVILESKVSIRSGLLKEISEAASSRKARVLRQPVDIDRSIKKHKASLPVGLIADIKKVSERRAQRTSQKEKGTKTWDIDLKINKYKAETTEILKKKETQDLFQRLALDAVKEVGKRKQQRTERIQELSNIAGSAVQDWDIDAEIEKNKTRMQTASEIAQQELNEILKAKEEGRLNKDAEDKRAKEFYIPPSVQEIEAFNRKVLEDRLEEWAARFFDRINLEEATLVEDEEVIEVSQESIARKKRIKESSIIIARMTQAAVRSGEQKQANARIDSAQEEIRAFLSSDKIKGMLGNDLASRNVLSMSRFGFLFSGMGEEVLTASTLLAKGSDTAFFVAHLIKVVEEKRQEFLELEDGEYADKSINPYVSHFQCLTQLVDCIINKEAEVQESHFRAVMDGCKFMIEHGDEANAQRLLAALLRFFNESLIYSQDTWNDRSYDLFIEVCALSGSLGAEFIPQIEADKVTYLSQKAWANYLIDKENKDHMLPLSRIDSAKLMNILKGGLDLEDKRGSKGIANTNAVNCYLSAVNAFMIGLQRSEIEKEKVFEILPGIKALGGFGGESFVRSFIEELNEWLNCSVDALELKSLSGSSEDLLALNHFYSFIFELTDSLKEVDCMDFSSSLSFMGDWKSLNHPKVWQERRIEGLAVRHARKVQGIETDQVPALVKASDFRLKSVNSFIRLVGDTQIWKCSTLEFNKLCFVARKVLQDFCKGLLSAPELKDFVSTLTGGLYDVYFFDVSHAISCKNNQSFEIFKKEVVSFFMDQIPDIINLLEANSVLSFEKSRELNTLYDIIDILFDEQDTGIDERSSFYEQRFKGRTRRFLVSFVDGLGNTLTSKLVGRVSLLLMKGVDSVKYSAHDTHEDAALCIILSELRSLAQVYEREYRLTEEEISDLYQIYLIAIECIQSLNLEDYESEDLQLMSIAGINKRALVSVLDGLNKKLPKGLARGLIDNFDFGVLEQHSGEGLQVERIISQMLAHELISKIPLMKEPREVRSTYLSLLELIDKNRFETISYREHFINYRLFESRQYFEQKLSKSSSIISESFLADIVSKCVSLIREKINNPDYVLSVKSLDEVFYDSLRSIVGSFEDSHTLDSKDSDRLKSLYAVFREFSSPEQVEILNRQQIQGLGSRAFNSHSGLVREVIFGFNEKKERWLQIEADNLRSVLRSVESQKTIDWFAEFDMKDWLSGNTYSVYLKEVISLAELFVSVNLNSSSAEKLLQAIEKIYDLRDSSSGDKLAQYLIDACMRDMREIYSNRWAGFRYSANDQKVVSFLASIAVKLIGLMHNGASGAVKDSWGSIAADLKSYYHYNLLSESTAKAYLDCKELVETVTVTDSLTL